MTHQTKGTNGFEQLFEVQEGKKPSSASYLWIQGDTLVAEKDYFYFPWSGSQPIQGEPIPGLREVAAPWIIDLGEGIQDNANNPHFDLSLYVYEQSKKTGD